jgi:hypothetical protein
LTEAQVLAIVEHCRKIAATALAPYFPVVEADLAEVTLQSGRLTEQQALSRSELAEPR